MFGGTNIQASEYEKALLVSACWRLAQNNDINELLAIGCCIRNWVVPRYGAQREPMAGDKIYFASYSEAIENFYKVYPTRDLPSINEGALIDPDEGLLVKVDGIYDCSLVDMTSSRAFPFGARYFGRNISPDSWLYHTVLARRDAHPLIGNFGSQAFYA